MCRRTCNDQKIATPSLFCASWRAKSGAEWECLNYFLVVASTGCLGTEVLILIGSILDQCTPWKVAEPVPANTKAICQLEFDMSQTMSGRGDGRITLVAEFTDQAGTR